MKKWFIILCLVSASFVLVQRLDAKSADKADQPSAVGEIRGIVSYCGLEGSEGIDVYIPGGSFIARTGPGGEFKLSYVPPGTYNLVIFRNGQRLETLSDVVVNPKALTDLGSVVVCPDLDGDGYDCSTDCDDMNTAIHPNATELCDGLDNDCDGAIDEGCPAVLRDIDGDGFASDVDCNDYNATINTSAKEICGDGKDNDCDGDIDESDGAVGTLVFYLDVDGDGFGDNEHTVVACTAPAGYVSQGGDCDDNKAAIGLGTTYYLDRDGDGYGNDDITTNTCGAAPAGYVVRGGDCNDQNVLIHPLRREICDGLDNNCNGLFDEGAGATWYRDNDADGYGNPDDSVLSCEQPYGYVQQSGDCNDDDGSVHPGVAEVCGDGKDNNCNGLVDMAAQDSEVLEGAQLYYPDYDGDGYGIDWGAIWACSQPVGYATRIGDCWSDDPQVYPGATEIYDGKDNNCDGAIDEGYATILSISRLPARCTAGQGVNDVMISALDSVGHTITSYGGTIRFTSSDPLAVLPANYVFVPGDAGTKTFTMTLITAGSHTITATDTESPRINGSANTVVNPANTTTLYIEVWPPIAIAGEVPIDATISARDAFGNIDPTYCGTIRFTSSDPMAVLPEDYSFMGDDAGMKTFNIHLMTAGNQTITATDTVSPTINGAVTVHVDEQ